MKIDFIISKGNYKMVMVDYYTIMFDDDNFISNAVKLFQEISLFLDTKEKRYDYCFKNFIDLENIHCGFADSKTILKIKDLEMKTKYIIDLKKDVGNGKCIFIENFVCISYEVNREKKSMFFDMKNKIYFYADINPDSIFPLFDQYFFTDTLIQDENGHEFREYVIMDKNNDNILIFPYEQKNEMTLSGDFLLLTLQTLIQMKLGEKYTIECQENYGPFLNTEVNICFKNETIKSTLSELYNYDSEFINEQLENGSEIHFPLFNSSEAESYKFLHFIDSKSLEKWIISFKKLIL